MFSVVSVRHSVHRGVLMYHYPWCIRPHCTGPPFPLRSRPHPSGHRTCSLDLIVQPTPPPTSTDTSDGHTSGKRVVSIQLECFLVSNITNVNSTVVSKYYFQQLLTNVEVPTFEGSSAPSVQYQPSISVTSLPSQIQLTVDRSGILDEQSNSNNLVIMDSTSDGTSILDMDSGLTSHSK